MPKPSPEDLARHDVAKEKSQGALESVTTGSYKYNRPSDCNREGQERYDNERKKAKNED